MDINKKYIIHVEKYTCTPFQENKSTKHNFQVSLYVALEPWNKKQQREF